MWSPSEWFSYGIAVTAVGFAVAVVTTPRILRAAVYLLVVLLAVAGAYVMLGAEFLAGVQALVYVGGIVVVIVFAVMLTSSVELREAPPPAWRRLLAGLAALGFFGASAAAVLQPPFAAPRAPTAPGNTSAIGEALLDYGPAGYVIPFELISLLLLSAAIGGIVIARRVQPAKAPASAAPAATERSAS